MDIRLLEVHIALLNMAGAVRRFAKEKARQALGRRGPPTPGGDGAGWSGLTEERRPAWWVLVCGQPLDPDCIDRRDEARERLRDLVTAHGIAPKENVWVWDSTGLAQLVVGEFRTRDRAEEYAKELRRKGLKARVRLEMK